jgi:hypothetical protein
MAQTVNSTFDLYLPQLAQKLGFQLPRDAEKRREFWFDVNGMFLDTVRVDSEKWLEPSEQKPATTTPQRLS